MVIVSNLYCVTWTMNGLALLFGKTRPSNRDSLDERNMCHVDRTVPSSCCNRSACVRASCPHHLVIVFDLAPCSKQKTSSHKVSCGHYCLLDIREPHGPHLQLQLSSTVDVHRSHALDMRSRLTEREIVLSSLDLPALRCLVKVRDIPECDREVDSLLLASLQVDLLERRQRLDGVLRGLLFPADIQLDNGSACNAAGVLRRDSSFERVCRRLLDLSVAESKGRVRQAEAEGELDLILRNTVVVSVSNEDTLLVLDCELLALLLSGEVAVSRSIFDTLGE